MFCLCDYGKNSLFSQVKQVIKIALLVIVLLDAFKTYKTAQKAYKNVTDQYYKLTLKHNRYDLLH